VGYKNNPFAPFSNMAGFTTLNDEQYVLVRMVDHQAFVPAIQFGGTAAEAFATLKKFNVAPTAETRSNIMAATKGITDFPIQPYLSRPGSTPPYFALQDGTVIAPKGVPAATAIYPLMGSAP
jgi:hypothetical protein